MQNICQIICIIQKVFVSLYYKTKGSAPAAAVKPQPRGRADIYKSVASGTNAEQWETPCRNSSIRRGVAAYIEIRPRLGK